MPEIDLNDPNDLKASMDHWRDQLAKESAILERHGKARDKAAQMVKRRAYQLKLLARRGFGLKIVQAAVKYVGTTENPANSNRGPHITVWQERFGLAGGGYPWCGAFVGAMVEQAGGDVTNRIVYTPYIVNDAKAKTNGFEAWIPASTPSKARPGDLVLFNWPGGDSVDHVGILREKYVPGSNVVKTVEGNTSPTNAGSQANGGGVFLRERSLSLVAGFARPKEKK